MRQLFFLATFLVSGIMDAQSCEPFNVVPTSSNYIFEQRSLSSSGYVGVIPNTPGSEIEFIDTTNGYTDPATNVSLVTSPSRGGVIRLNNMQHTIQNSSNASGSVAKLSTRLIRSNISIGPNQSEITFRYFMVMGDNPGSSAGNVVGLTVTAFVIRNNDRRIIDQVTFNGLNQTCLMEQVNSTGIRYTGWTTASLNVELARNFPDVQIEFLFTDTSGSLGTNVNALRAKRGHVYIDDICGTPTMEPARFGEVHINSHNIQCPDITDTYTVEGYFKPPFDSLNPGSPSGPTEVKVFLRQINNSNPQTQTFTANIDSQNNTFSVLNVGLPLDTDYRIDVEAMFSRCNGVYVVTSKLGDNWRPDISFARCCFSVNDPQAFISGDMLFSRNAQSQNSITATCRIFPGVRSVIHAAKTVLLEPGFETLGTPDAETRFSAYIEPLVGLNDCSDQYVYRYGVVSDLGLDKDQLVSILAYPNPANDRITILCRGDIMNEIRISSLEGKQMLLLSPDEPEVQIDVSQFAAGLYLVDGTTFNGQRLFTKFIKK